jgi:hypothetical protein
MEMCNGEAEALEEVTPQDANPDPPTSTSFGISASTLLQTTTAPTPPIVLTTTLAVVSSRLLAPHYTAPDSPFVP